MYFVHNYVPETSGKSLEEIACVFDVACVFDATTGTDSMELAPVRTFDSPPPTPPRAGHGDHRDCSEIDLAALQPHAEADAL
jgi:hypothetical protein